METPFIFGKIASGGEFTDRERETDHLIRNFQGGINTILISPRRWGKSSLVNKASAIAGKKYKKIVFCFLDLYTIRTEEEFYNELTRQLLKSTASKLAEIIDNSRKFLGRFLPKITYSTEQIAEFSIGLDWNEVKKHPEEILNLAEKIAVEKKIKIVVCIDEFQNISEFDNPLSFQKKVRAYWQKHKNVSYCLYGSKRHMLMEVFASSSMPFYKFGDIIFLQKIKEADWQSFIVKRYADTGKKITEEHALLIARLVDCHPYYVQQLAQQAWLRTVKVCNKAIVEESFDSIVMQLSMLFQTMTDSLSTTHVKFLKALLEGVEQLSSKETLSKYNLGTSANVLKIKQALINKEIIDIQGSDITFLDPVYRIWLQKYYFKIANNKTSNI
ncbi:MAG: AAA family ATPase [Cytophagaceae bacterium]